MKLLSFQITLEIPEDTQEDEQIKILETVERLGIERQALEGVRWHLNERKALKGVTAKLEQ